MSHNSPQQQRLIDTLLSEGEKRRITSRGLKNFLTIASVAMCLFEIWLGFLGKMPPLQYSLLFLMPMMAIVFLTRSAGKNTSNGDPPWYDLVLSALSLATGLYILIDIDRWLQFVPRMEPLSTLDMAVGIIILLLVIELTRRTVGVGMTAIALVFIAYVLWGDALPGSFSHRPISLEHFVGDTVYTINGIFGVPVNVAATYAFLFVLFGNFFAEAGGGQFFFDLAASLTGTAKGGPAKIAVISSGMYGMISGSPVADVVTTGSITIPMMKRLGYTPTFAGAVEAVASTGGSIMPPIMGTAAFLMVEFTGIPYSDIIKAAAFPAILYYIVVYTQVHCRAENERLVGLPRDQIPAFMATLKKNWFFFLPLVALVWLIEKGFTPSYVAVVATAVTIVLSWFTWETKVDFKKAIYTFETVVDQVAALTGACAAAGIVIGSILITGLGGKFGALLFSVGTGNLFLSLLIGMGLLFVLGMGMPTPSAYVLAAVIVGPVLKDLGVSDLSAHLFIVYYACMAAITPPVATAAFAAAGIAEANAMQIGWQAVRLGIVAFVIPFIFVYEPALLMVGNFSEILVACVTAVFGAIFLAVGIEGLPTLPGVARILLTIGGILTIIPGVTTDLIGFGLAIVAILLWKQNHKSKAPAGGPLKPVSMED